MKKTRKFRILSILLAILMVMNTLSGITLHTHAATTSAYDGTPVTPKKIAADNYVAFGLTPENWSGYNGYYGIRTAAELYGFANLVNGGSTGSNAVLLQDIVVNETVSSDGAAYEWTPIGKSNSYLGTFDGNGHTIRGLYCSAENVVGLFGYLGTSAKTTSAAIKNVTLDNSYFKARQMAGGIAASTMGYGIKITNCKVGENVIIELQGDDHVSPYTGGILGMFAGLMSDLGQRFKTCCTIENCVFLGKICSPNADFSLSSGETAANELLGAIVGMWNEGNNAYKFVVTNNCYYISGAVTDKNGEALDFAKGGTIDYMNNDGTAKLGSVTDSHTCVSVNHKAVTATCIYQGVSEYSYCLICEAVTGGTKNVTKATDIHMFINASCISPGVCVTCDKEGAKDASVHTSEKTVCQPITGNLSVHNVVHECCKAIINTQEHSFSGGDCLTAEVCSLCEMQGNKYSNNHASNEYVYVSNESEPTKKHDKIHKCCNVTKETLDHNFENAVCKECKYVCQHPAFGEDENCTLCGINGIPYISHEWDGEKVVEKQELLNPTDVTKIDNSYAPLTLNDGWYIAEGNISQSGKILYVNGNVNILLCDGASITIKSVVVRAGNTVNIYTQSNNPDTMGKLIANCGIGADDFYTCGTINIHGGRITATGENGGVSGTSAGIGGYGVHETIIDRYADGHSGDITIYSGIITATGAWGAAGIGGGVHGNGGNVTIHGGTITATGGQGGAGIGGGTYGNGGNITIHGGTITATGRQSGAGIGGGYASNGATVVITGGNIKATPGNSSAEAIGKGEKGSSSGTIKDGNGADIVLNRITLTGATAGNAVTKIEGISYGHKDVYTLDADKLYFYLPAKGAVTSVTADEVEYVCNRNLTFYTEHAAYAEATCFVGEHCSECGYVTGVELGHDYVDGMCIRCGIGEEDGIFYIGTAKQLRMFEEYVNAGNKTANAKLMADIDLENEDWTTICETGLYYKGYGEDLGYAGTFDGNGHVIKNVKVTSSTTMDASCGLFGTVSGTIKNLGVEGFTFVDGGNDMRTGAIVGQLITANGRVENCYTKNATIKPGEHVTGGIAGGVYDGTIENCYVVESDINGTANRYGYIVGDSRGDGGASDRPGTVNNCYTDHATIRSNNVGNITNCATKNAAAFASGEVTYLLNGSKSDGDLVWYQTLTEQAYPQFKGVVVYYDETNGYTNHIHEWTYEKDGDNKIIATCNVDDCYNPDGGSVTIIAPENPVYDQAAKAAAYESTGNFEGETYTIIYKDAEGRELQDAPANAGTYTAELTAHDCTAELEFTIEKAEVTIENVHLYDSKPYDGTAVFTELDEVNIAGVLEGDEVAVASIEGTVASADVGLYHELTVTAIKLTGKDADNYQIKLPAVANVVDHIGNDGALGISPLYLTVIAKDQTVSLNGELDQTQWELTDGSLIEGQKLEVTLLADTSEQTDFGVIELEVKILDAEGNDVTDNYIIHQIDGALTVACADHTEFTNGFCNNCDGYQEPALDDNGTEDSWDDQYLIENAGQLFWIANYIHNVTNEVNVKVLNDITIPEGKEWTPIMNFYGTFDGNYHTISGMHVQSEGNQVGMFGGGGYFYGTVKNLHLSDSYFEGNYYVGGIAGYFGGTMENCYVDDTVIVKGQNFSAALVGDNSGTILNSYAYAEKLVGYNSGTTENSYYLAAEDDGNGGKTAAQFKSGEVAYLLQAGQQGETEWDDELQDYVEVAPAPQVWGQNIDLPSKDADEYPTFDGAKVYQMTESEVFYTNLLPGQEEEKESVTEVFVDVAEGAWYVDSVQYVYDEGIIIGDGNIFAPDNGTTRAMVAVILYRLAGSPDVTEADYEEYNKFGDLPKEKAWYSDAVAWALKEKVSTGDDYAMLYNPELPVTREQLALFLWRYAKYNEEDVTVTATKEELFGETYVNSWAEEGFAWAVDRGIIRGAEETDSEGNLYYVLNPQGGATRAQLARMLHRYLGESNG